MRGLRMGKQTTVKTKDGSQVSGVEVLDKAGNVVGYYR
jgi:hypothetical protein